MKTRLYKNPPPYFIVLASSVVIEFHNGVNKFNMIVRRLSPVLQVQVFGKGIFSVVARYSNESERINQDLLLFIYKLQLYKLYNYRKKCTYRGKWRQVTSTYARPPALKIKKTPL